MNREDALDAFAVGNSANGKSLVQSAPFSSDHDASKNLDPLLVALHHPGVHANAVADLELRGVGLELFLFNSVDDPVHNESSKGVAGGAELLIGRRQIANFIPVHDPDPAPDLAGKTRIMSTIRIMSRRSPPGGCDFLPGHYNRGSLRP